MGLVLAEWAAKIQGRLDRMGELVAKLDADVRLLVQNPDAERPGPAPSPPFAAAITTNWQCPECGHVVHDGIGHAGTCKEVAE